MMRQKKRVPPPHIKQVGYNYVLSQFMRDILGENRTHAVHSGEIRRQLKLHSALTNSLIPHAVASFVTSNVSGKVFIYNYRKLFFNFNTMR